MRKSQLCNKWSIKMKKIDYMVECDNNNLKDELKKNKYCIYKRFSLIVSKRRELKCYENCRNKKSNIKNEK